MVQNASFVPSGADFASKFPLFLIDRVQSTAAPKILPLLKKQPHPNISLLARQAREFHVKYVCIQDETLVPDLKNLLADILDEIINKMSFVSLLLIFICFFAPFNVC